MRPAHNEVLRESFESFSSTLGFNPAFIKRVREKRRREAEANGGKLTPRQKYLSGIAAREREIILAAKRAKRQPRIAIPEWAAEIVKEVAAKHDLAPYLLLEPYRRRRFVEARDEAIYRIKAAKPVVSLPQLGKWFKRDHTTVLASLRRHAEKNGLPPLSKAKSYFELKKRCREQYHKKKAVEE